MWAENAVTGGPGGGDPQVGDNVAEGDVAVVEASAVGCRARDDPAVAIALVTIGGLGVFVGGHLLSEADDLDGIRVLVLVVSRAEFVEDRDADLVTSGLVRRHHGPPKHLSTALVHDVRARGPGRVQSPFSSLGHTLDCCGERGNDDK